jgi:putative RNA 2'-phosphotransferase
VITDKETTHLSKFLSLVLRHKPDTIGLTLDPNGWADVTQLLEKLNAAGMQADFAVLEHVVATNAKKRFAFNEAKDKIRASQGHSVEIDLGYQPQQPPDVLYHGTAVQHAESIRATGLEKRSRQHVHLSADVQTATTVGQRHGKLHLFNVLAGQMHADGFEFYISENGVWLTDSVPAKYLTDYSLL